ncbi:MAG TPA: Gfo/Idh/MocA family oxidoreductase [Bryobacteraceae bacterium]|nr:Gfo/Idh/MocA family oxidoreductase [Bryobacteraceae bacterium]
MTVAVLGYGLIGRERVQALLALQAEGCPVQRILLFDPALAGARPPDRVEAVDTLQQIASARPDWVIVATPHDTAAAILSAVLPWGSRVLVEKPLGRSLEEARAIAAISRFPDQLWVGFNYRFFPGVREAICDARSGRFGPLVNVTMILGHGGAPGMERGWKFDPVRAGGGCLIDPGVHLLDLCRLLAAEPIEVPGATRWDGFWKTGIEEEVHLLLKAGSLVFNLQISIVRWRSAFRVEIHGCDGYGVVTGRGRSYGPQRYIRGARWAWQKGGTQAEREEVVLESEGADTFRDELRALLGAGPSALPPCPASEALEVMALLDRCRSALGLSLPSVG